MNLKSIFIFLGLIFSIHVCGQADNNSGSTIQKQIEKLNVLDKVLYFAAHPDDENTRLISYLSKGKNVTTAYFSLTRGDGGQNLIGDEKGALLGIIRTQELLAARKLDGGTQYFSRAIDFGYSKTAKETFKHWNKDSLLADAVLVIRKFKPDVIITRFPPDTRAGHGHHTVSAIIAAEAFSAAADPNQFPESAKKYGTWQTQKMYWNESSWWNKDIDQHRDEYVTVDIGAYDPLLGVSYSEIASKSRSQHQSQGFGMSIQRGERWEYLKLILGDSTIPDVLTGKHTTWNDIDGGGIIETHWSNILQSYTISDPTKSIAALTQLYFEIQKMPENHYKNHKLKELKNIIASCGGLWLDFRANQPLLVQNEDFSFTTYAISQSAFPYRLKSIKVNNKDYYVNTTLDNTYNEISDTIPAPSQTSTPYWLRKNNNGDMFIVEDRNLISQPENNPVLTAKFTFKTLQGDLVYERPLIYKWTDRVRGELYRPANIVEPISISFDEKISFSKTNEITVRVQANKDLKNIQTKLFWAGNFPGDIPEIAESIIISIPSLNQGQSKAITFTLDGSFNSINTIYAKSWIDDTHQYNKSLVEIEYPHIPTQVVLPSASTKLITENIIVTRKNIGYIMGSGDEIPTALQELGCEVTILEPTTITLSELQRYDGVIVGIRAYNKVNEMNNISPLLKKYVFEGGFVMVQYNTNRGLITEDIGPYPIQLSRTRVTEEDAPVTFLQKKHPILNTPNQLTSVDFDLWVQERGLYFADKWDEHYTPILGWNDTGEDLAKGSLIVTEYGKGHYVFTGISFFRQLPAGVVGAYKLYGNLISYGSPQSK